MLTCEKRSKSWPCPQESRLTQSMPRRLKSANVEQLCSALGLRHSHVRRLVDSGGCQVPVQQRGMGSCSAYGGSGPTRQEVNQLFGAKYIGITTVWAVPLGLGLPGKFLQNAWQLRLGSRGESTATRASAADLRKDVPKVTLARAAQESFFTSSVQSLRVSDIQFATNFFFCKVN